MILYTVGHSTRSFAELVQLLHAWRIQTLVDVRTIPRSRTNPQFNRETLADEVPKAGLHYVHMAPLGGLRGRKKGGSSRNTGWRVDAFRNYADYAQTQPFARALDDLLALANQSTCAIMCAEAVWWRCHRRIIADYLVVRGAEVQHILSDKKCERATLTPFARRAADGTLVYPGE